MLTLSRAVCLLWPSPRIFRERTGGPWRVRRLGNERSLLANGQQDDAGVGGRLGQPWALNYCFNFRISIRKLL